MLTSLLFLAIVVVAGGTCLAFAITNYIQNHRHHTVLRNHAQNWGLHQ